MTHLECKVTFSVLALLAPLNDKVGDSWPVAVSSSAVSILSLAASCVAVTALLASVTVDVCDCWLVASFFWCVLVGALSMLVTMGVLKIRKVDRP